jgi:hypothetical protein
MAIGELWQRQGVVPQLGARKCLRPVILGLHCIGDPQPRFSPMALNQPIQLIK